MRKLTTEQFIKKAREIHNDKYDYSKVEYVNTKIKVCIICPKHGEFEQKPNNHLQGQGCPVCKKEKLSVLNTKDLSDFVKEANEIHNGKYDYSHSVYVKGNQKIYIVCPKHGEFYQTPENHLQGKGCPKCANERISVKALSNTNEFRLKSNEIHNYKYDYSKVNYIDSHTKVCIICPEHGEFWQTPNNHLNGKGCPVCKVRSILENKMKSFLTHENIKFIREKTFDWLKYKDRLRLDFYLPDYNIAIECQGRQHFTPKSRYYKSTQDYMKSIERDKTKYKLCVSHDIKIIYFKSPNISITEFYSDKIIIDSVSDLIAIIKSIQSSS